LLKKYRAGFSLIELLVVVAVLGVISAIGVTSYTGYVSSTEKKSAQNLMAQISLGQQEYMSDTDTYFGTDDTSCTPDAASTKLIFTNVLNFSTTVAESKEKKTKYKMCAWAKDGAYGITAANKNYTLDMSADGDITERTE
jgi:type IV pilus assembly protein PilE